MKEEEGRRKTKRKKQYVGRKMYRVIDYQHFLKINTVPPELN